MAADAVAAEVLLQCTNDPVHLIRSLTSKLSEDSTSLSAGSDPILVARLLLSTYNRLEASGAGGSSDHLNSAGNITDALTLFMRRTLTAAVVDDDIHQKTLTIAEMCSSASPSLRKSLVGKLVEDLSDDLEKTISYCYAKDGSDDTPSLVETPFGKERSVQDSDTNLDPPPFIAAFSCLRYLAMQPQTAPLLPLAVLRPLLVLLAAKDSLISASSRDTFVVMIKNLQASLGSETLTGNASDNDHNIPSNLWAHIFSIIDIASDDAHIAVAYSAWLAVLTFCPTWAQKTKILHQSCYWRPLHTSLALGTQGQCKLCLAILKTSLRLIDEDISCHSMHFEIAQRAHLLERYDKYETVYVTIVLNRYVNQIRECIDDLLSLVEPSSGIDAAWLIALFSVSVDKGTQDSVRRFFGNLIMDHAAEVLSRVHADPTFFLVNRFLPWAVHGSLLVSSMSTSGDILVCHYGEKLSSFVKSLVLFPPEQDGYLGIIRSILGYVDDHNDHAFPYAKAFLIQGLSQGIQQRNAGLDHSCLELLSRVAMQGGYLKIVGLWVLSTVARIGRLINPDSASGPLARVCEDAEKLVNARKYQIKDPTMAAMVLHSKAYADSARQLSLMPEISVTQLLTWLNASKHRCLTQNGLLASCVFLKEALSKPQNSASDLAEALDAVWEELDIQEFDRDPLMLFPSILLHRNCISLCQQSDVLRSCVIDKVAVLQELSQYRIHLFSALAEALRRTALHDHGADILPWDDIIVRFAANPPVTKVEFQLEATFATKLQLMVPELSYESFYGKSEGRAYAAFFDLLNAMPVSATTTDHCSRALDAILQPWLTQKQPVSVTSRWKNTTQLQILLILSEWCLSYQSAPDMDQYLQKYLKLVAIEPLPRYRFLLEWMIARVYLKFQRQSEILERTRDMDISNPKLSVSFIKIALALACVDDSKEEFAAELMTQLMVLAASPKVAIRHEGQWSIPILWDHALEKQWTTILDNPAVARLNDWLRTLEPYKNPPAHRLLERFDPHRDHNLSTLLDGDYLAMEPPEKCHATRSDFHAVYEDDMRVAPQAKAGQVSRLPLGDAKSSAPSRLPVSTVPDITQALDSLEASQAPLAPLQTKGDAWRAEVDALLASASTTIIQGPERHAPSASPSSRRSRDLIVVASLIDKPHNIGGISRVSEILGCASLVVHDRRVLKSKDFTSVAVSSELWLPIEEVPCNLESLTAYLTAKKLEGYTVVGIEQTDDSRVLGTDRARLPERLVLVLGSEREGIPARILGVCDWCVEIRQSGVTRSMNVQTAAGVVLYEYDRWWGSRGMPERPPVDADSV